MDEKKYKQKRRWEFSSTVRQLNSSHEWLCLNHFVIISKWSVAYVYVGWMAHMLKRDGYWSSWKGWSPGAWATLTWPGSLISINSINLRGTENISIMAQEHMLCSVMGKKSCLSVEDLNDQKTVRHESGLQHWEVFLVCDFKIRQSIHDKMVSLYFWWNSVSLLSNNHSYVSLERVAAASINQILLFGLLTMLYPAVLTSDPFTCVGVHRKSGRKKLF